MRTPLLVLAIVLAAARAQADGRGETRLEPAEPGSDWYTLESLDLRGEGRLRGGVMGDWAYRPRGGTTDAVRLHARAGWTGGNRYRVGLALPVVAYRNGRGPDQAVGDLRLTSDVRVFGSFGSKLRGAWGFALHAPTGSRAAGATDGTFRLTPRASLAGSLAFLVWAVRVGYAIGRDEVVFGVGAAIKVHDRFVLGPELAGVAAVRTRASPIEILLGGRVSIRDALRLGTAIGRGVDAAEGAPDLRVLAVAEWAPEERAANEGRPISSPSSAVERSTSPPPKP